MKIYGFLQKIPKKVEKKVDIGQKKWYTMYIVTKRVMEALIIMATSKQIRAYAKEHNCSNAEARAHFIESAEQEAKANQIPCTLFIKKTDTRDGSVEFSYAEIGIPKTPYGNRNELIGCLGRKWLNDSWPIMTVACYLSHSPSLTMAELGLGARFVMNNLGPVNIDLDNLGCVIEFEADARGVSTQGPRWMSPKKVAKIAKNTAKKYRKTHNIVGEVA